MKLRTATELDAATISSLITEVAKQAIVSELTEQASQLLLGSFEPSHLRRCLSGQYQYWVAEEAGKLVGVLGLKESRHLYHLFVARSVQGTGLGRRLWDTCLRERLSCTGDITVNSSLNAVGFYEALGFVRNGSEVSISGIPSQPLRWSCRVSFQPV